MEVREHYASGGRKFAMMSKVIVAPTPKKVGRSVPYITMQSVQALRPAECYSNLTNQNLEGVLRPASWDLANPRSHHSIW
jgi:hypothetical protein